MRFEVPQFIEIEDKIFGPLTWRQFVYLAGGIGMAVVLFLILPFILFIIIGLPLAALSGALAFFPVNNRPFSHFLGAIYNFMTRDRLYLWNQKPDVVYKDPARRKSSTAIPIKSTNRGTKHKSITALTRALELQSIQKPE